MITPKQVIEDVQDDLPTPQELKKIAAIGERVIKLAYAIGQPERAERIRRMLDELENEVWAKYQTE